MHDTDDLDMLHLGFVLIHKETFHFIKPSPQLLQLIKPSGEAPKNGLNSST